MKRDGHLSKGVRIEAVNAAKLGNNLELVVSTDDALRILAEMRRSGKSDIVCTKTLAPNRKLITFNQPK